MNIQDLPVLVVSDVQRHSPQLKGEVSRWHWVGEGHIAYLYLGGDRFVEGKFRNVNESTKSVSFAFKHPDSVSEIKPGEPIPYLDGYWGERALIVFDKKLDWHETTFQVRDAVHHRMDGTSKVDPGGWDHEHCAICWATISENENRNFVKSTQGHFVCLDCFRNHVEPRSIDFIEEA